MRGISADPNEGTGRIVFDDWGRKIDVLALDGGELDRFRTKLQFIFQDPFGSLNPRMTVYDILVEPLIIHGIGDDAYRREMVSELMEMVGLDRRHLEPLPALLLGRPAPEDRHRPRAGAQARHGDLRRAGVGARRVDPGADPQPAARTCRSSSASPTCSSRTTWRWSTTSPTASP